MHVKKIIETSRSERAHFGCFVVMVESRQTLQFQRGETTHFSEKKSKRNRLKCIKNLVDVWEVVMMCE